MVSENKIANLRKSAGFTQKEISDLSGLSVRTLQNWESGRRKPRDVYELAKLAKVLNVHIEDLIEIE